MYYILKCFDPAEGFIARIEYRDDDPFRFWNGGERFDDEPETPLRATVVSDAQSVLAELWETPLPMMTARLHQALCQLGVSNLDVYPVELTDSRSGKIIDDYLAFNLIGVIAAADLQQTRFAPGSPERMISADIDHLVVAPDRIAGAHMFRLGESVSAIVVDQQVRDGLIAAGFDTLSFLPADQWVG